MSGKGKLRISFNAPATLTFALVCLGVQLLSVLTGGKSNETLFSVYRAPLLNPLTWIRFFTHVLGHAGWDHLLNNMMYLLILGPMLEEKYGGSNLFAVMVLTAGVTGVIHFIFFPAYRLMGASGVVFAFILLSSITGFREKEIPLTFLLVALVYIGQQVYAMVTVRDSVSQLTHIIGGAVGASLGFVMNKWKMTRWQR